MKSTALRRPAMDAPGPTPRADETNFALSLADRIALFDGDAILSTQEFAALRCVSAKIVQRERAAGIGCPFISLSSKRIGYRLGDAKNFLRARRVGVVEESAA